VAVRRNDVDAARRVVVLLDATAAKSLMGNGFRLTAHRGEALHLPESAETAFDALVSDLRFTVGRLTRKT
jgi:hypothetical protein